MTFSTRCDMHVHTNYSHDCDTSLLTIKEATRKQGMMVAITDHNEIGGSLAAAAMGIPTIPAIEVTTHDLKDLLIYFYTHADLVSFYEETVRPAKNPGLIFGSRTRLSVQDVFDALENYRCFTSLAHPYCPYPKRSAGMGVDLLRQFDAIEVMNFGMSPKANQKAAALCDELGLAHTAGSDSHHPSTLGAVTMYGHTDNVQDFLTEAAQSATIVHGEQRTNRDVVDKVMQYVTLKTSG